MIVENRKTKKQIKFMIRNGDFLTAIGILASVYKTNRERIRYNIFGEKISNDFDYWWEKETPKNES